MEVIILSESLYPVFEVPTSGVYEPKPRKYSPAPSFDFYSGDFVTDGTHRVAMCDGREAYRQWCRKIISTQRGSCLAYMNIGIEREEAYSQPTREAVQAAFERTITESLLMHPCTLRVKNFEFAWEGEKLNIAFTVQAVDMAAFNITLDVIA